MEQVAERKRKTETVPADILAKFRKYVRSIPVRKDCVEDSGFNEKTIKALMKGKTCSPDTIVRIEQLLQRKNLA